MSFKGSLRHYDSLEEVFCVFSRLGRLRSLIKIMAVVWLRSFSRRWGTGRWHPETLVDEPDMSAVLSAADPGLRRLRYKRLVPFSSHMVREEGQTRSAAAHIHHSLFHSITCFQIADNVEVDGRRPVIGDDAVGDVGPLVQVLPLSDMLLKRVQIREDGWMQATAPLDTALVSAAAKLWLKMH